MFCALFYKQLLKWKYCLLYRLGEKNIRLFYRWYENTLSRHKPGKYWDITIGLSLASTKSLAP